MVDLYKKESKIVTVARVQKPNKRSGRDGRQEMNRPKYSIVVKSTNEILSTDLQGDLIHEWEKLPWQKAKGEGRLPFLVPIQTAKLSVRTRFRSVSRYI